MSDSFPCPDEISADVIELKRWRTQHESAQADHNDSVIKAIIRLDENVGHGPRLLPSGYPEPATGLYKEVAHLADLILETKQGKLSDPPEPEEERTGVLAIQSPGLARKLKRARLKLYFTFFGGFFGALVYTILKLCKVPLP